MRRPTTVPFGFIYHPNNGQGKPSGSPCPPSETLTRRSKEVGEARLARSSGWEPDTPFVLADAVSVLLCETQSKTSSVPHE